MTKYKVGLYIVSLILLFVSIIIKTFDYVTFYWCDSLECVKHFIIINIPSLICIILIGLGFVIYRLYFRELDGDFAHPKTVKIVENISNNHLSFLATYILPFVTFEFVGFRNWVLFLFMIVVIGVIYVKTNFFYTNPTLSLFGVYVYYVSFDGDDNKIIAIARRKLRPGDTISRRLIDENIYFVK